MDALHQARRVGPRGRRRPRWALRAGAARAISRRAWQRARRGHLGGARPAAALHALEGDGVGRVRPRGQDAPSSSAATGRSSAGARCATTIHAEVCAQRLRRRARHVRAVLRLATTLDASLLMIPLVGFLPADDPRVARHGRGDRARAAASTASCCATAPTDAPIDGLPPGEGAFLRLQLLAGRHLRAAGPARRRARAVRAPARAAQRRRAALRGVRPARAAGCSATSRRRSRTSR